MSENITLAKRAAAGTEVHEYQEAVQDKSYPENYGSFTFSSSTDFSLGMADSPHSVDSGMARSPVSACDVTTPGSPSSSGQEFFPSGVESWDNSVGTLHGLQYEPAALTTAPSSPHLHSPSPKTQTKGADDKTIQKLLELLIRYKTSPEPTAIPAELTNYLRDSIMKAPLVPNLLPSVKKGSPRVCSSQQRKRPINIDVDQVPSKEPKFDDPNGGQSTPSIVILEQPEKNYRARYESEGCRGPVHGCSDLTFPTIKVNGYNGPLWVTVYLAAGDGTPHFHLLCGPGSSKLPCRDILLPDGVPAVQVLVGPETEMTAVLDNISLKRRRNFEADKELKRRGLNPVDWKTERKEACFVFTAEIPGVNPQVVTCKSRVFQCTAPPGNPEIWWMKPEKGFVTGGEEIGLIGKKFQKGFKVRFFGDLPSGKNWEAFAEVDRTKSNQGAAVIKSPCLEQPITSPLTVNVEICHGKGNNYVSSDSMEFTYLPLENRDVNQPELNILPEFDICELMETMSQYLPDYNDQSQEWKQISTAIEQLHRNGAITVNQLTELKNLVSLQDTILLQAFRSSRESVSGSEFLGVFRQYLAGLTVP